MDNKIYWHLPGFCVNFYLNQIVINLMKEHPDKFRDGHCIGSVYGTFPGAIWNGGRFVHGISSKKNMEQIIGTFNRFGVPVRFTWTNSLLEEKHVNDTYCNMIMDIANNGNNQVLVNSQALEDYLRVAYPDFKYISSTTKRITTLEGMKEELDKGYYMVVLDYDLNHDEQVLKSLEPEASRVEILVDEICYPNCPKRTAHYRDESLRQLTFDSGTVFDCPNRKTKPSFAECKKRPSFISNEEIEELSKRGYVNYKLVGRGLPQELLMDSYMYYLVKDEHREFIRNKIEKTMRALLKK